MLCGHDALGFRAFGAQLFKPAAPVLIRTRAWSRLRPGWESGGPSTDLHWQQAAPQEEGVSSGPILQMGKPRRGEVIQAC